MLPPLYPHQHAALDRAALTDGNLALFHDPGLGKTRTCLELYSRLRAQQIDLKLLVVCPLSLIDAAWGVEIAATAYTRTLLKSPEPNADIWLVNFEALIRPTAQRYLAALFASPVMLVVDESSRLRDPRARTTKTVHAIAEHCRYRVVCSGTPAPNGLYELWGQVRVVDPNCVPSSYYAFRRTYFHLSRGERVLDTPPPSSAAMQQLFRAGWQWTISETNRRKLLQTIAPLTHWVKKEHALALPERITQIRHLALSQTEQAAYNSMKRQLVVEFAQETVTAELALTKLQKLRQLSSGFLYGDQGAHRIGNSRLRLLEETLDDLGNQPILIWAHFHEEIEQIKTLLGERAVTLYSQTADKAASLAAFGTTAQYLIAHPRSAAHGLTLVQSATMVWYSLDWSLEAYSQGNDRIHRIGQQRSCLYVHLIAKGLIDEQIWSVLQQKTDLQTALYSALGSRAAPGRGAGDQAPLADGVGVSSGGSVAERDS